jgi:tRNA(fMet)-specific endonuclease VapC
MKVALDTNRYRDLCEGDEEVVRLLENAASIHVPLIVIGELRAGFALGRKGRENEAVLQRFLMKPGVEVLYPGDATTHHYASLFRQLRQQGTPIPTNDLWIAALVLERDLVLCSRDEHFRHVPQLTMADDL